MGIPATVSRYTATPIQARVKRKVAAYARVSTDHEDQLNSYEAQCDYYTNYIQANDEWEFVGVYSDEGISGTSTRRRDGFNRMVEDVWNESTVKSILTNEKYKGCALLQKHYTADYLTKKIIRNDGAVPQ